MMSDTEIRNGKSNDAQLWHDFKVPMKFNPNKQTKRNAREDAAAL